MTPLSIAAITIVRQHYGYLDAAVTTAIVNSAGGCAALSLQPDGMEVRTVGDKVNFPSPAVGRLFGARRRVTRTERALTVCTGAVVVPGSDGSERLAATMLATR